MGDSDDWRDPGTSKTIGGRDVEKGSLGGVGNFELYL
jgi:hypothetical protein